MIGYKIKKVKMIVKCFYCDEKFYTDTAECFCSNCRIMSNNFRKNIK